VSSATRALLEVDDLHVSYGRIRALHGVSLAVPEGAVVALIGANGAGKSTLLRAISGILRPRRGAIRFGGKDLVGLPVHQIARRRLIHVPEGRGMLARMTVLENLRVGGFARRDRAGTSGELDRIFALFPVLRERREQPAGSLSGGEQQMLAIGRAMMAGPRLLMLDEPSLGLAPAVVESMYETFGRLHREGLTILLAEQSIELALEVSDFATVLQVGKSVLSGTAAALAEDPQVQKAYLGAG